MIGLVSPGLFLPRPDLLYRRWRDRPDPSPDSVIIQEVLAGYGLELVEAPHPLSGGNRSRSVLVNTSAGKKVLKKYRKQLQKSTVVYEHSILSYLAQIDFPAPRLNLTSNHETILDYQQGRYALFDFIEGGFHYHNYLLAPWQVSAAIKVAGEMLARLHLALRNFVPEGQSPDGFESQTEDRGRDLGWFLEKLAYCRTKTLGSRESTEDRGNVQLLAHISSLEKSLVQLDAFLQEAALPRLVIHADYGPYNLLFRQNAPAVIIDFEIARLDWRITDFIHAWYRFCYGWSGFKISRMDRFLTAYQALFPLTEIELELIPAVWKFLNIRKVIVNWFNFCETGDCAWLTRTEKYIRLVDWITNNQAVIDRMLQRRCC
jgi:Ser/Thr protein kinase RdoA (MazF antagonist)